MGQEKNTFLRYGLHSFEVTADELCFRG